MVKKKTEQGSNAGSNQELITNISTTTTLKPLSHHSGVIPNISKDEKSRANIMAKLEVNNGENKENGFGSRDTKEKKSKSKKVYDLSPSEKTVDDTMLIHAAPMVLSKSNHKLDKYSRKEDVAKKKLIRHTEGEKFKSPGQLCDEGRACSENRSTDDGGKASKKFENMRKRETKKEKPKVITNFNFLKNVSPVGDENLKDEIIYDGLMRSERDRKNQRKKKENYNDSEYSTTCADNCNLDEARKHDKKRKRKDYLIESELGEGCSKDNEASEKAYKVISGSDAHEIPLLSGCDVHEVAVTIQLADKPNNRENEMEYLPDHREFTLEATRNENGDHRNTPSTTNHNEHNRSSMKNFNTGKRSKSNESDNCEHMKDTKKGKRKVSFSSEVEEFPVAQSSHKEFSSVKSAHPRQHAEEEKKLIWGKRYTPEEDELIRQAIMDYIEVNQLGDQGLHMVLHCQKYKKVRGCWNFIASALPWRPRSTTYLRAHSIFEKCAVNKWEPEQCELLKRCYAEHGPDWKKIAQIFGLSRHQVKDAYRRLIAENLIRGKWRQFEYQSLFDLVNLDLRMKAFQEKKSNHSVIRDNISWQAISVRLSTRAADHCCMKWYARLATPMVREGRWNDLDDYKMIYAIQKADPSCFEEVDWDNLLENRSGEICRKRWYEMIKHLERFWAMPFVDQIDLLSQRYCPDMIPYREKDLSDHPVS